MPVFPTWLHAAAIVSLAVGVASAMFIAIDETRSPQAMKVMYFV